MCQDALEREESRAAAISARSTRPRTARPCATTSKFCHVAAWEYSGDGKKPVRNVEPLHFEQRPSPAAELQVSGRMNLTLQVWRQKDAKDEGGFVHVRGQGRLRDMSFLEMLDVVNEELIAKGEEPIAFDHDCREGICGTCGLVINGHPHGPRERTTACQLHMRSFKDGDEIVDRALAGERLPGGQGPRRRPQRLRSDHRRRAASSRCPPAARPTANALPGPEGERRSGHGRGGLHRLRRLRRRLQERLGHAVRRGQGVAARLCCRRASPSGTGACWRWSAQMDDEGFGSCTNHGECEAACPKGISVSNHRPAEPRLHRRVSAAATCARRARGRRGLGPSSAPSSGCGSGSSVKRFESPRPHISFFRCPIPPRTTPGNHQC